jgi:hypothetical protein
VRLKEQIDEKVVACVEIIGDFLVSVVLVSPDRCQFQTVERALAGKGFASVALAFA